MRDTHRTLFGVGTAALIGLVIHSLLPDDDLKSTAQRQNLDQATSLQTDAGIEKTPDAGQAEAIQENLQSQVKATVPEIDKNNLGP